MQKKLWLLMEVNRCEECGGGEHILYGVVEAETPEEVAKKTGGELQVTGEGLALFFARNKFEPTQEDCEHFPAGTLLEYRKGSLCLHILPEESGAKLYLVQLPHLAL